MFFAKAVRQASKYSIGATPTARLKRSKNAERESAACFANCNWWLLLSAIWLSEELLRWRRTTCVARIALPKKLLDKAPGGRIGEVVRLSTRMHGPHAHC
jgi:hypothetical protein